MMAHQSHNNNTSREGKTSIWIFEGKWLGLLVAGCASFVLMFRTLANMDIDWPVNLVISVFPLAAMTAYVAFFVNGKPPSYSMDLLLLGVYRLKAWLFKRGALDKPPVLWILPQPFSHPEEF